MEIKVINQRKFQLLENHKIISELYYPKWWSNNAEIRYLGKQFEIKAKQKKIRLVYDKQSINFLVSADKGKIKTMSYFSLLYLCMYTPI